MDTLSDATRRLEACIVGMNSGDVAAREEVFRHCAGRFEALARRMLKDFAVLRRWEETGDILQNGMLRLLQSLETVEPTSMRHFLSLAALQMRRQLIDMARRYRGPLGLAANHASWLPAEDSQVQPDRADRSHEPGQLAQWCELHTHIQDLPAELREVCDLLWYQGLTQPEAAVVLNVSQRTIKRRWQTVRLKLADFSVLVGKGEPQ